MTAPRVMPPPELRARILAGPPSAAIRRPRPRALALAIAWACAALVIATLLGWTIALQRELDAQTARIAANKQRWQLMSALLNDPDVRWYPVAGDLAQGHVWFTPQGKVICLVAHGLPALPSGRAYQVWLIGDDDRASGGMFKPEDDTGWIVFQTDEPLARYDSILVTVEPQGDSTLPSGPPVLRGDLTGTPS